MAEAVLVKHKQSKSKHVRLLFWFDISLSSLVIICFDVIIIARCITLRMISRQLPRVKSEVSVADKLATDDND
jgi:hypothetical protein